MALKIRRDDHVVVISGKDRGKTGKVLRVDPKKEKVFVQGLNIVKRHMRPSPMNPNAEAGVVEREGPIHVSNVALVDPGTDHTPTRVGVRRDGDRRFRVARRSDTQID